MEVKFETIDEDVRREYERFFFEKICSMNIGRRRDFTIPLQQVNGLYFTSVQDTVERLTELTRRVSTFQWRNCIFAPISKSTRPREVYKEVFERLKERVPSLFVRSYVYLIFIKLESNDVMKLDFGEGIKSAKTVPDYDSFQIYYWNTNYQVKRNSDKRGNLFGDTGVDASRHNTEQLDESYADQSATPEKLFIVQNPAHELQRIQDANSDIIDAFNAFNKKLPLVDQTKNYLEKITGKIDENFNARILVEGPARSGKTVLAMSLLAKYPKSKMLLMNWYFYDALMDAFKIWAELSAEEIEQLFSMPKATEELVASERSKLKEFQCFQSDTKLLEVALRAIDVAMNPRHKLPRWSAYTNGHPTPRGDKVQEWRAKPVSKSAVGDFVPVISTRDNEGVMQIVEVINKHDDGSASVQNVKGLPKLTINNKDQLLEYDSKIKEGRAEEYIAMILKDISDALHNSTQRFFHHNLESPEGCWVNRGNPTTCNITSQDLIICDEVQRLGVIPKIYNRDEFDETEAIFKNSKQSFLCGDDFQMLNPIYDQGIGPIEHIAGEDIYRLKLPDSIGVPAEVGRLIKYLLDEHAVPQYSSGFEIQLLYRDDIKFVEMFEADGSTKKHYAIPNNSGFYRNEPYILRSRIETPKCTDECGPRCEHKIISMLTPELRQKFKFFCSEAVMPNFALSAYELISREVESVYIKIPEEIGLQIVRQPFAERSEDLSGPRNWKKQHLYVLMTRATMRLVLNIEDRALYKYFSERLRLVTGG